MTNLGVILTTAVELSRAVTTVAVVLNTSKQTLNLNLHTVTTIYNQTVPTLINYRSIKK